MREVPADFYDRIIGFTAKCASFKVQIKKREDEIAVLENDIKLIRAELDLTFDEWMNCKDEKAKDKLEWKRNKLGSQATPKIYRIQGLKKEIKDIESEIVKYIREGYTPE